MLTKTCFFLSHPITRTCYVEVTFIGDLMIVRRVWLPCLEEQLKITISTKSLYQGLFNPINVLPNLERNIGALLINIKTALTRKVP